MPYRISRHPEQLLWVVLEGHLSLHQAESYLREVWDLLDDSPVPQDILVDGRQMGGAEPGARRRTEQIIHHPNVGHLAFVVGELHVLLLAPLMKLVAGVGLFADEHAAQAYLRSSRGLPPMADLGLPNMPPPPPELVAPKPMHAQPPAATEPLGALAPRVGAPAAPAPHSSAPAQGVSGARSSTRRGLAALLAPAEPPAVSAPPASSLDSSTPPVRTIVTRRYVGDPQPRTRQLPPPLASRTKHTPLYPATGQHGRSGSGDEER